MERKAQEEEQTGEALSRLNTHISREYGKSVVARYKDFCRIWDLSYSTLRGSASLCSISPHAIPTHGDTPVQTHRYFYKEEV